MGFTAGTSSASASRSVRVPRSTWIRRSIKSSRGTGTRQGISRSSSRA
jgi:hypothetical protein